MKKAKSIIVLVLVASILLMAACGGQSTAPTPAPTTPAAPTAPANGSDATNGNPLAEGPQITLIAASSNVEDHPYHQTLLAMNDFLVERTEGRISLDIFSAGQMGSERELAEAAAMGAVDLIVISNAPFTNFEPSFMLWDLPFLANTRAEYFAILDSDFGREMLDRLEDSGFKGLAFWDASYANLYADRAVQTPEDIVGMNVRVLESEVYLFAVEALGANPVTIAWPETYTALQNRTVSGALTTTASGFGANLIDVAPYYTLLEIIYMALPFVISLERWNSLSEMDQELIMEAALFGREFNRSFTAQFEEEIYERMRAAGGTVTFLTEEEHAAFVAIVRDFVFDRMVGEGRPISAEDVARVEEILAAYRG